MVNRERMNLIVINISLIIIAITTTTIICQHNNHNSNFGLIVNHRNKDGKTFTKEVVMNNGRCLPLVAFGTYQLGNDSAVRLAIRSAIMSGYHLIDTAYIYQNEEIIGDILQEIFREGLIDRTDLFVTTKVWNNQFSKSSVIKSIRESLKKLKLSYLDLVLLHYPTAFKENSGNYPKYENGSIIPRTWNKDSYIESWKAMENAVQNRLTKSIGVSNFNRAQMRKLISNAKIKPVLNQVESHPNLRQEKLLKYLTEQQILMQAYAPIRKADKELLNNPVLVDIAQRHNKTSAHIALRWQLQRGVPIVVKSSNPKRIKSNLDVFDFNLNDQEMEQVNSLPQKERIYDIDGLKSHPDYPFNEE